MRSTERVPSDTATQLSSLLSFMQKSMFWSCGLLKSNISTAEQVVSLRLRQLASTTDDYEEQIALAAALKL